MHKLARHILGGYRRRVVAVAVVMAVVGAGTIVTIAFSPNQLHPERMMAASPPKAAPSVSPAQAQTVSTPSASAAKTVKTTASAATMNIGMFIDAAPSDPNFRTTLDAVAATGCNTVYSYNAYDGTAAQVNAFLAYAQSKGLKVIIGLNDFYDGLHSSASEAALYPQYGSSDQDIALSIVRDFQANPDVWGFSITDEVPQGPGDLATWQNTLITRYRGIKAITAKPVMAVLVGWPDDSASVRTSFFSSAKTFSNTLALDYYPVPYLPLGNAATIMQNAGPGNWFVEQDFSWASYPDTASGLGFNVSQARLPTESEMLSMANSAIAGGAKNLLFYSYFDIKDNQAQLTAVKQVISTIQH